MAGGQTSTFPILPVDDARIQAVTFHPVGQPIAPPVISLAQSQEQGVLELRFDDMTGEYTTWEVQIVHCDRMPSFLQDHPAAYDFFARRRGEISDVSNHTVPALHGLDAYRP